MDDNEESGSVKSAETAASHEEDVEQSKLIMYKHFVLPKRSTRSSRIIKPNKRLLEMGGITSTTSNSSSKSSSSSSSKKSANSNEISAKTTTKATKNYFGLGDLADETAASSTSSIALGLSLGKDHFPLFGSMKQNGSSFVLRKSRLQLQTDNSGSTFAQKSTLLPASTSSISSSAMSSAANAVTFGSSLSSSGKLKEQNEFKMESQIINSLLPISVTPMACAVCATPVNMKAAPLARKYGVIACEVCRKFISRMTKISKLSPEKGSNNSSSSTQQLQCKGGSTEGK